MKKVESGRTLTRQKILEAALQLIDRDGLEGFNMRKLGTSLGVEAMSLYNHIESKDALFDGVIEILLLKIPYLEEPDITAYDELWSFLHAYRNVLRAHPRVLPLVATRQLRTEASLTILERLLATLHRANVRGIRAIHGINSLVGFLIGHELLDIGNTVLESTPVHSLPWQHFSADQYPLLHAVSPDLEPWDPDQEFEFGLQALLQSIFMR